MRLGFCSSDEADLSLLPEPFCAFRGLDLLQSTKAQAWPPAFRPQVQQTGGMILGASTDRKKRQVLGVLAGPYQHTEWSLEARTRPGKREMFQLSTTLSVVLEGSPKYVCGGGFDPAFGLLLVEGRRARPSGNVLKYQILTFSMHLDNRPKAVGLDSYRSPLCSSSVCRPLG